MNTLLFLDNFCLDECRGIERRFFQPERVNEYVFLDEHPLAGVMEYVTVLLDAGKGLYRMWYLVHLREKRGNAICYAESGDGVNWEKVEVPVDTDRMTAILPNAVFSGKRFVGQGAVTHDEHDADPARRYKLAYWDLQGEYKKKRAHDEYVMRLAYSPDGIGWTVDLDTVWHPTNSETENAIVYNPVTNRYQIMCRAANLDRRIAAVESADLETWSEPSILLHPEPGDPVGLWLYGMPVVWYEDLFLGFLWKFQAGAAGKAAARGDGYLETELAYSYNGLAWNRTHWDIIQRSERGTYGGGSVYFESLVPGLNDDLYLYSRGCRKEHHHWNGGTALILHKLRRDGFVGLDSFGREGYIRTKPFLLDDAGISLNVQAPFGTVKVQISDKEGAPYPGFAFDECEGWGGDDLAHKPRWREKDDLRELVDKPVRFEILLEEGTLFSIRARMRPFHGPTALERY